jgi:branched-chain amino acid transport system ATP-binding protein
MVAIGRALMSLPKVLMLDEPSLGLAPLVVRTLFKVISEINTAGTTVVLVERNVKHALSISSQA